MTKRTILLSVGALALGACSELADSPVRPALAPDAPVLAAGSAQGDLVVGRLLARFTPGAPAAQIARAHGAGLERPLVLRIQVLSVPAGRELEIARALSRNPNVEFAEPDWIRTFGEVACGSSVCTAPDDKYFGYKWDHHNDGTITTSTGTDEMATGKLDADIDWLEAYDLLGGAFGGSAVVGIGDTGVRPTHEELKGRVKAMTDFYGSTDGADDYGHGTHVAGIAAGGTNNSAGVTGVAFGANIKIVSAKMCGYYSRGIFRQYGCSSSAITSGIKWLADQGAHTINLSLGGPTGSSSEQEALRYALGKGSLPFCATGNDNGAVSYPAAFPECVAVASTDWGDDRASYSNYGPEVEIAAPGGDDEDSNSGRSYILSAYHDGDASYVFMAGTSMATPQAAGLGALLAALGVSGPDNIRTLMKSTVDDLGAAGWDPYFGEGRINAYRAVQAALGGEDGGTPSPPPPAGISLSASGYKVKGVQHADLKWSGATSTNVDVFRDGAKVTTTANDGAHTDNVGKKGGGSYTYRVCEAGTSTCSNEATVTF